MTYGYNPCTPCCEDAVDCDSCDSIVSVSVTIDVPFTCNSSFFPPTSFTVPAGTYVLTLLPPPSSPCVFRYEGSTFAIQAQPLVAPIGFTGHTAQITSLTGGLVHGATYFGEESPATTCGNKGTEKTFGCSGAPLFLGLVFNN